MLDAKELKLVMTSLSSRRAWLLKSLEDAGLDENVRIEHQATMETLDLAMQKLATMHQRAVIPTTAPSSAGAAAPVKNPLKPREYSLKWRLRADCRRQPRFAHAVARYFGRPRH